MIVHSELYIALYSTNLSESKELDLIQISTTMCNKLRIEFAGETTVVQTN